MALCEMCGRTGDVARALVEGVELSICAVCSKYGKRVQHPQSASFPGRRSSAPRPVKQEKEWKVVEEFPRLLRSLREKSKLNQEDFARFLQERESVVGKWEAGSVKPSIETAKKLEKFLGVTLVVVDETVREEVVSSRKSDELTLGDFVKVKKK